MREIKITYLDKVPMASWVAKARQQLTTFGELKITEELVLQKAYTLAMVDQGLVWDQVRNVLDKLPEDYPLPLFDIEPLGWEKGDIDVNYRVTLSFDYESGSRAWGNNPKQHLCDLLEITEN